MFSLSYVESCVSCSDNGTELLRPRHRSLVSSSSNRLLSLAEAQARERSYSAIDHLFDVGGDPSSLPSTYRSVFYYPKKLVVIPYCNSEHCIMTQLLR